jgi:hypothetical protein
MDESKTYAKEFIDHLIEKHGIDWVRSAMAKMEQAQDSASEVLNKTFNKE